MSEFEIIEDHLKLVRAMYMDWNGDEFGAPGIDCKRPYGNSLVWDDLARILDIEKEEGEEGFTPEQIAYMQGVWLDTQNVLQILIDNLDEGIKVNNVYKKNRDTGKWVLSYKVNYEGN